MTTTSQPDGPNVIKLRAKFDELRASGLLDMKFHPISAAGITIEDLAGEVLTIIDIYERGDFIDISEKLG